MGNKLGDSQPASMEPEPTEKKYGKYDDYEIENAARTLMDAEKIKADKEKMKYVKMCMGEQAGHIESSIASMGDLKAARDKSYKEET